MPGEDLYGDAVPANAPEPEAAPEQEEAGDSATAELPKAVLGGKDFKPGEEVVLQVVQVMEDSVLVKYASKDEPEEEAAPAEAPQMSSMAEGGGGGNPGPGY